MLTFTHDADRHEFRATEDERLAGLIRYRRDDRVLTLEHTETTPEFQGQGVAGRLMEHVVEEARAQQLLLAPECSYAASWLDRHPEHAELRV